METEQAVKEFCQVVVDLNAEGNSPAAKQRLQRQYIAALVRAEVAGLPVMDVEICGENEQGTSQVGAALQERFPDRVWIVEAADTEILFYVASAEIEDILDFLRKKFPALKLHEDYLVDVTEQFLAGVTCPEEAEAVLAHG